MSVSEIKDINIIMLSKMRCSRVRKVSCIYHFVYEKRQVYECP